MTKFSKLFLHSDQTNLANRVILVENGTEHTLKNRYGPEDTTEEVVVTLEEFNSHVTYTENGYEVDEDYYYTKNFRVLL